MKADVRRMNIRAFPRLAGHVQGEPELHVLSDCGFMTFLGKSYGRLSSVRTHASLRFQDWNVTSLRQRRGKLKLILYS